jgi:hypothetical protein
VDIETKILNDLDEKVHWMRNCFKYGTIGEHWKQIQSESWFDPSFQVFVNKELIPGAHKNSTS